MEHTPHYLDLFPFLRDTRCTEMALAKGAWVFREHEGCGRIGFVLEGSIKVFKEHTSGRSITLYRLGSGDSCILSMSCAMANPIHQASAIVEDDCRILTVTTDDFRKLMDRSAAARDYVFGLFASRLTDVLLLLEEVVFRRMDERLASILLEHAVRLGTNELHTTHEVLAEEAGTAREVVTRVLREFVASDLVHVRRGVITILDRKGLARIGRT